MPHFFISYAKKDTRDLALSLNEALNAIPGVTAWVDKSLRAGRAWAAQIEEQIDLCDTMVVLVSPDLNRHKQGLDESYVLSEITYAKYTKRKMIIPVMAQPSDLPIDLTRMQYIDFTIPGLALADLVSAICDDAGVTVPSASTKPASPIQSLPVDPLLQAALERARAFKGTRNRDWNPFIHTFAAQGIAFEMCLVPPGTFQMGGTIYNDEQPIHTQTLSQPFWIARHPVTNRQWRAAVEASGTISAPKRSQGYNDWVRADHPVVSLTWFQCQAFIRWLGQPWRLPTEAEWEYAACGVEAWRYPWGNDWQPDKAVFRSNSNGSPAAVGSRPAGASWVGAEDLSGNIQEWTSSLYKPYPYQAIDGREADTGDRTDVQRGVRGGSFNNARVFLRGSNRIFRNPGYVNDLVGFRCARF